MCCHHETSTEHVVSGVNINLFSTQSSYVKCVVIMRHSTEHVVSGVNINLFSTQSSYVRVAIHPVNMNVWSCISKLGTKQVKFR